MELLTMVIVAFGLLGAAMILRRHEQTLDQMMELITNQTTNHLKTVRDADNRMDKIVNIHNACIDHYDDEIDQIIARMDQITADIAELNKEHQQDRRDLTDIRTRYINYREPAIDNSGVNWSKSYVVTEDYIYEEHQKDNKIQD